MGDSELSSEEMQELQKGGEMPKEKRTGGILDLVQGEQLAQRVSLMAVRMGTLLVLQPHRLGQQQLQSGLSDLTLPDLPCWLCGCSAGGRSAHSQTARRTRLITDWNVAQWCPKTVQLCVKGLHRLLGADASSWGCVQVPFVKSH